MYTAVIETLYTVLLKIDTFYQFHEMFDLLLFDDDEVDLVGVDEVGLSVPDLKIFLYDLPYL